MYLLRKNKERHKMFADSDKKYEVGVKINFKIVENHDKLVCDDISNRFCPQDKPETTEKRKQFTSPVCEKHKNQALFEKGAGSNMVLELIKSLSSYAMFSRDFGEKTTGHLERKIYGALENSGLVKQKENQSLEQKINEQKIHEHLEEKMNRYLEQKIHKHLEQKINEHLKQKVNECFEQKVNEYFEQKVNEYFEQKVNENFEQKVNENFDQKVNENFEQKIDRYLEQKMNNNLKEEVSKDLNVGNNSEKERIGTYKSTKKVSTKAKKDDQSYRDPYSNANNIQLVFSKMCYSSILTKEDTYVEFLLKIENVYKSCIENVSGTISDSVGLSRKNNQDHWIVAICTVDGQHQCYGTEKVSFSLQECADPINYCLATEQYGTASVHEHIGFTPSSSCKGDENLSVPLNPFTDAGRLLIDVMLSKATPAADRFEKLTKIWKDLVGDTPLGYSNSTFLSKKQSASSIYATGYLMKKAEIFPDEINVNVPDVVDFLLQNQSMTITSEQLAVAAATLANRGKCPLTGKNIFSVDTVRNCISLMANCGFGHFSGECAFRFGLPAMSSCDGSILLSIPNVMGVCLYSPRLNDNGHSARGVDFIEKFCKGCVF